MFQIKYLASATIGAKRLTFLCAVCALISGCSKKPLEPSDINRIDNCINRLEIITQHPPSEGHSELNRLEKERYQEALRGLADMKKYYEKVKLSGIKEDFRWEYKKWGQTQIEEKCPFDAIEYSFGDQIKTLERKVTRESASEIRRSVERDNKMIDEAQDAVINDHKKKAVKHYIDTSGHSRIDLFTMKDGRIVTCTTTVANGEKAVSCR